MAFTINSTAIPQPTDVRTQPRPLAFTTLSGKPVYQGFEQQTWIYKTLDLPRLATIWALYNPNSPRVQIGFLDEKTGTWLSKWATMQQPVVGNRETWVAHDVSIVFSRIADSEGA